MKIVGLTGGIGSGKSTVSSVFRHLGYPVYDSDSAGKNLYDTDSCLQNGMTDLFGPAIYINGSIDKKSLSERLFQNKSLLTKVEALVHPAVRKDFLRWKSRQTASFVLFESALLLQKPLDIDFDKIIVVCLPEEERIARVRSRNQWDISQIKARMAQQMDEKTMIQHADYLIDNREDSAILPQILRIIQDLEPIKCKPLK